MARYKRHLLWVIWVFACLGSGHAWAQTTGQLRVTVVDGQMVELPGALVWLHGTAFRDTPLERTTDALGQVLLPQLPPGSYTLRVSDREGQFGRVTVEDVRIRVSRTTQVEVELRRGAAARVHAHRALGARSLDGHVMRWLYPDSRALVPRRSVWTAPHGVGDTDALTASTWAHLAPEHLIPELAARRWEFFNRAQWDYPRTDDVVLHAEAQRLGPDHVAAQIAVVAPHRDPADRPPLALTLVVGETRASRGLVRQALQDLTHHLRPGDVISMMAEGFDGPAALLGHRVRKHDGRVARGIDDLIAHAERAYLMRPSLAEVYALAQPHVPEGYGSRVVLLTSGLEPLDAHDMYTVSAGASGPHRTTLVAVGLGDLPHGDGMLAQATDLGRGAAVFVGDVEASRKLLRDRGAALLWSHADDVRIQLELPPDMTVRRAVGAEKAPDDLTVWAEPLAEGGVHTLYRELHGPLDPDAQIAATVHLCCGSSAEVRTGTWRVGDLLEGPSVQVTKARAILALTDMLSGSDTSREHALEAWRRLASTSPGDPDLDWIRRLLQRQLGSRADVREPPE